MLDSRDYDSERTAEGNIRPWTWGEWAQFLQGPDLQDPMGESPVGLRCPGDLIDLQCATSEEEGGCIRSSGGGQTSREEGRKCGEMSNSSSETLAGHQARGSQNSSGSRQRTGGAFTSRTNEGPNQTGTGNWGKKNNKEILGNYKTALFQTMGRKWSRTSFTLFPGIWRTKHLCKW